MISLPAKPTRAALISGLLLVLLVLLVLTLASANAHPGGAPLLHHHPMIASNATTGGPGWP